MSVSTVPVSCTVLVAILRATIHSSPVCCVQGDPLATTLRVKVVAVRYLTIADRVIVGTEEQSQSEDEGAAAMDKQDGVAIEISNPLAAVLLHS